MTIFQIQCFLSVAETLSFTEAANQMYIAQSSLSRNISHLEEEVGMALFARTKKNVQLTPSGTVLYTEFSKLLKLGQLALEKAKNAELGKSGVIKIGVLETQRTENFLPERISHIRQAHPNIQINMKSGTFRELRNAIKDNLIDLAITLDFDLEEYPTDEIIYQVFFQTRPKCVISKSNPLASSPSFQLGDLSSETMIAISPEESKGAYNSIIQFCERHNITPANTIFVNSIQNIRLEVESGIGFSVLDDNCFASASSSILSIPFDITDPLNLIAVWKKENMNPVIPLFTSLFTLSEDE